MPGAEPQLPGQPIRRGPPALNRSQHDVDRALGQVSTIGHIPRANRYAQPLWRGSGGSRGLSKCATSAVHPV
jgi:hypothetical protein